MRTNQFKLELRHLIALDAVARHRSFNGAAGELRVGTYQSVATRLLPAVLARFRERWPRIDVQLYESGSHDEIDGRVERGALDLAFTTPPIPDEPFDYV